MQAEADQTKKNSVFAEVMRLDGENDHVGIFSYLSGTKFDPDDLLYCLYHLVTNGRFQASYVVAKLLEAANVDNPAVDFARCIGGALFGSGGDEIDGTNRLVRSLARLTPEQFNSFRASLVIPTFQHAASLPIVLQSPDLEGRLQRIRSLVIPTPQTPTAAANTASAPVPENQLWPVRRGAMTKLIKSAFQVPITAMEIGVWYGVGSTNIWLENLLPGSTLMLFDAWKPYASPDDLKDPNWNYQSMDDMCEAAFMSAFQNVKKFEAAHRDRNVSVFLTRADSYSFLPLLRDDTIDFIYIDGDHKYERVKADVHQAKRLVNKKYGVICGDDLEKLPSPEFLAMAKEHKNVDYIRAPFHFHPGVMLAVSEEFPLVNMMNGFWWVVCKDGQFTTEIFPSLD